MTCNTHRDYLLINSHLLGFMLKAPRPEVQKYIELFKKTLGFSDTLWWIIDYKEDPGVFRCSKRMVEAFELDDTADRHSIELTCPIAGNYRYQVAEAPARSKIFDEYHQLLNGDIEEFNNQFPYSLRQTGAVRHFNSRALVLERDDQGKAQIMYGILRDISESVDNRERLLENSHKMMTMLDEKEALIGSLEAELARDAICQEHDYGYKWVLDLKRKLIQPDAVLARWQGMGWQAGHWYPVEQLHESIPLSHYQSVTNELKTKTANLSESDSFFIERPLTRDDTGETVWVKLYGKVAIQNGERLMYGQAIDVTEQINRKRELETLLERQRSMFAILGHELRTPAAAISMLAKDTASPKDLLLDQIHDVSEGLLTVLEDLRVVIAPDRAAEYKPVSKSPKDIIERAIRPLSPLAHQHGVSLIYESNLNDDRHQVYEQLLRQSVTNLVKNAIVHSKGTQVQVNLAINSEHNEATLIVEDDGVGLPSHMIETVYEPFIKGNNSSDGSGIGLFVAKEMAERMQGELADSASSLGGAKFTLTFPVERAQQAESRATTRADLTGLRVLLAEDDLLIRTLTHQTLGRAGAQVEVAEDGKVALGKFERGQFDLVLTDIMMPELDGFGLTRALRELDKTTPIIALTAAVLGEETDRIQDLGATGVLPKPINLNRLMETLQELGIQSAA